MDDDQFDALSARLAGHMTRRRGIALGSALGLAGIGSVSRVDARKR